MIILVNDANIFIDLLEIDLLESFFQLQYEFHVTDLAAAEVQDGDVSKLRYFIENDFLFQKSFSYEELEMIQSLEAIHQRLSIADCSCLFYVRGLSVSAKLLTGDAVLRKTAEREHITVHGILWIFDELIKLEVITKVQAHEKLSLLITKNSRLPAAECKKRLKEWKQG